ncbi:hypothetical protein LEP1GSC116_1673, partial [Leptospira interrogans serovar Icterohaemorrhagiae str. Verdun HP]
EGIKTIPSSKKKNFFQFRKMNIYNCYLGLQNEKNLYPRSTYQDQFVLNLSIYPELNFLFYLQVFQTEVLGFDLI